MEKGCSFYLEGNGDVHVKNMECLELCLIHILCLFNKMEQIERSWTNCSMLVLKLEVLKRRFKYQHSWLRSENTVFLFHESFNYRGALHKK